MCERWRFTCLRIIKEKKRNVLHFNWIYLILFVLFLLSFFSRIHSLVSQSIQRLKATYRHYSYIFKPIVSWWYLWFFLRVAAVASSVAMAVAVTAAAVQSSPYMPKTKTITVNSAVHIHTTATAKHILVTPVRVRLKQFSLAWCRHKSTDIYSTKTWDEFHNVYHKY